MVTWQSFYGGYPQSPTSTAGNSTPRAIRMGAEFSMNSGVGDDCPSVSMAPLGAFVVAWTVNVL